MIRYSYNRQLDPPAPFVHATFRCVEAGTEINQQPAQLDVAADRTVVPGRFVEQLGLVPLDEITVAGFGGHVLVLPTYRVQVSIRQMAPVTIEVIAHSEEPFVLLGRDILNHYRIVLDGPQLFLEIE